MHILIAVVTAIAGLIWALVRLQDSGINLNAFNPFYWARRRKWEQLVGTKPLHRLDKPMDVASVLVVAVAKMDGEITREQKAEIIALFESEFKLAASAAAESYAASSYLLQDVVNFSGEVRNIVAGTREQFQPNQVQSLLGMLNKISTMEGAATQEQKDFISEVEKQLGVSPKPEGAWK